MNIFYLDHDVKKCAEYHVDSHVTKMITEYSQMLSTAHRVLDEGLRKPRYLMEVAHLNHPSTKWVRENIVNYLYLRSLLRALIDEYDYRYGVRTNFMRSRKIALLDPPKNIAKTKVDPVSETIPLAMPEPFKNYSDRLQSYRNFYRLGKKRIHRWTKRPVPDWI